MPALPVPTDAELEELARILDTPEIPSKLRCGICDLLAYDTMRLPCCSTNICDKCFQTELNEECIICCHKPLEKSLCEPNKPMRITIKALLKRKFNDRVKKEAEAAKVQQVHKEEVVKAPVAVDMEMNTQQEPTPDEMVLEKAEVPPPETPDRAKAGISNDTAPITEESTSPVDDDDIEIITELPESQIPQSYNNNSRAPAKNPNFNMNGTDQMDGFNQMNGMLPMDLSAMMAANGMMPMAGMSNMMGMNMMPMLSQMFGGFDNLNGAMNGMNMGMAMGYDNSGSWMNNNQGNFNNDTYGNGNFGNSTGYSMSSRQNNFNEQSYANNDFQRGYGRQGFQNRRGRRGHYNGGFGRGGYHHHQGNNQYDRTEQEHLYPQQNGYNSKGNNNVQGDVSSIPLNQEHDSALDASFAPGGEHDFDEELGRSKVEDVNCVTQEDTSVNKITKLQSSDLDSPDIPVTSNSGTHQERTFQGGLDEDTVPQESRQHEASIVDENDSGPRPIQAFVTDETRSQHVNVSNPHVPTGPASHGLNHAPTHGTQAPVRPPIAARGVGVTGAPSGPKALREGLPNTGRHNPRYNQPNKPMITIPSSSATHMVESPKVIDTPVQNSLLSSRRNRSRSRSASPARNGSHNIGRSRSRSFSNEDHSDAVVEHHRGSSRHHGERYSSRDELHGRNSKSSRHKYEDDEYEYDGSDRQKHRSGHHRDEAGSRIEDDDDQRASKRSHRHHDESKYEKDVRHRRSSRKSRHNHDDETGSSSHRRHRHRSESRGHSRSEKTHARRGEKDLESDYDRTSEQSSQHRHHKVTYSRRKRTHDYDSAELSTHNNAEEAENQHYGNDRKRSRHDRSPASSTHFSIRGRSKPNTPLTASFEPPSGPSNRRSSSITNGKSLMTDRADRNASIPTGPRASNGNNHNTSHQAASRSGTSHPHSNRRESESSERVNPAKPAATTTPIEAPAVVKDPHTLEREARDRERLQREMQRRAFVGAAGGSSGNTGKGSNSHSSMSSSYEARKRGSMGGGVRYEDDNHAGSNSRRVEGGRARDRERTNRW